jgi:hypothetical protein
MKKAKQKVRLFNQFGLYMIDSQGGLLFERRKMDAASFVNGCADGKFPHITEWTTFKEKVMK